MVGQYTEMELSIRAAEKQLFDMTIQVCPKCDSEWFEVVELNRIRADSVLVAGQRPAIINSLFVLKCCNPVCNAWVRPNYDLNSMSSITKEYKKLLEEFFAMTNKTPAKTKDEVIENEDNG